MKKCLSKLLFAIALLPVAVSCSTTKVLQEGQKRLQRNEVIVLNPHPDFSASSVSTYIR